MKKMLAVLAVLALAASAQAAMTIYRSDSAMLPVITNAGGDAVTTEDGAGTAYEILMVGDEAADYVAAVALGFTGDVYQIGFMQTSTVQVTTPTLADMEGQEYDPDGDGTFNPELDSHFTTAFNAVVTLANESNDKVFTPTAPKYAMTRGFGQLSVSAGIPTEGIGQVLHLGHIVVLDGDTVLLGGSSANGTGDKTYFTDLNVAELPIYTPEPASMLVLALGGLGVLARRRR